MPALPNSKHELFAQALAKGKTADEAYQFAGYTENRGNASRLKANESVMKRVEELTSRIADGVVLSKQWVLEQLIDNAAKAKAANQIAPANRALELIGREMGMFIDRREVGEPGEFDRLDASELREAIARRLGMAGAGDVAARASGEQGGVRGKPH